MLPSSGTTPKLAAIPAGMGALGSMMKSHTARSSESPTLGVPPPPDIGAAPDFAGLAGLGQGTEVGIWEGNEVSTLGETVGSAGLGDGTGEGMVGGTLEASPWETLDCPESSDLFLLGPPPHPIQTLLAKGKE